MKRSLLLITLVVAACSGDRHEPEPPPDPAEPFEDPIGTVVGTATNGPMMETQPAMGAKSVETVTSSGGAPGTSATTIAPEQAARADAEQIPHGPIGVGGFGGTLPTGTTTLGETGVAGHPPRDMTSAGKIR